MHPVFKLLLDPIRDNGDINGVAVFIFIALMIGLASYFFERMGGF